MAPDIKQDAESPLNFSVLATQTEGYSAIDLQDLVAKAVHQAAIRSTEKNIEGAEVILFDH
jgi:peroxin-1